MTRPFLAGRPRYRCSLAVTAAVAILASAPPLSVSPAIGQSGGFGLVGTHPQASEQPTSRGRTINFLKHWNGAIYAGYGDYGTNTGPIAITPFAVSTNQFAAQPAFWADSEELQVFRALNGNLYAPSIDPRVGFGDDYFETPLAGPWTSRDVVESFHVYDMAAGTGSDFWMVGSAGDNAVAWRSLDGGVTWSPALTVPPRNSGVGDFARFYFAGVYQNALYVQAADYYGGKHPTSKVFDGTGWSDGPDLLPQGGYGYDTELFDGQLVYLSSQSSLSSLLSFDGTEVRSTGRVFHNYSVDGDTLYGLGENGQVLTTTNLTRWTTLNALAPETARSIVVIDGVIYVGTTDSRIYKFWRPPCKGKQATIVGTNGADQITGTRAADVIVGVGGNDKLSGIAGNDLICGGAGKDTLKGGKGNDKLYGQKGKDTLKGGPGKDKLKGGAGKDKQVQ
jgi:Ca2+-binding RTX toxin-like protein